MVGLKQKASFINLLKMEKKIVNDQSFPLLLKRYDR